MLNSGTFLERHFDTGMCGYVMFPLKKNQCKIMLHFLQIAYERGHCFLLLWWSLRRKPQSFFPCSSSK